MNDLNAIVQTPGERLKILRKERHLTLEALASEIGKMQPEDSRCHPNHLSMVEHNRRPISPEYAMLFSEFFNVDANWILCKTDYRTDQHKFAAAVSKAQREGDYLYTGLWALASLNGYTINMKSLSGEVEEAISDLNSLYSIEKAGKIITLSVGEMNLLENEINDLVASRLDYLFRWKEANNG